MTSALSWLDTSSEDQRRMRELLMLFADTESRDELGIGQVRDAFSDRLFPGTSTLHTRARYLLIVPWCYREAEQRGLRGDALMARVDQNERRLIATMKSAGDVDGLIGRVAGVAVKTLPSTIYWGALGQFRIRTTDAPGALLRSTDVGEAAELAERSIGDWPATLPPAPPGFPGSLDGGLELSGVEAAWLREHMRLGSRGSLLAHFLQDDHRPSADTWAPWLDGASSDAPPHAAADLFHGEHFSLAMHGASLLYNLLLGQQYERAGLTKVEAPVERYEAEIAEWKAVVRARTTWTSWDRAAMWVTVTEQNPRIATNLRVRDFVDRWLDAVVDQRVQSALTDPDLHRMVRTREQTVKAKQSRFVNDKLLRTWSGGSGNRQLTFRWTQVRRLLTDVHNGLEDLDAAA